MYFNTLPMSFRAISLQLREMSTSRGAILKLYKAMLREAQKFPSYNFRMYALRRTRDTFRDNKTLTRTQEIVAAVKFAENTLEIIKRQVVIGRLYEAEKLVIEKPSKPEPNKCGN